ncbi:hypothetical protein ACFQX6_21890 [Streptosporangium lutulentum]
MTTRLPNPIAYNMDGQIFVVGSDDGGVLVFESPPASRYAPCRVTVAGPTR